MAIPKQKAIRVRCNSATETQVIFKPLFDDALINVNTPNPLLNRKIAARFLFRRHDRWGRDMPAKADPVQRVRHGNDFFVGTLAHEADLDPVFPAQIAAIVAQQVTGFLHRFADFHRVHFRRQRNGDDRRRHFRARPP